MLDGKAIGTIDTIEKKKAIVNYGIFTTNVNLDALEKVSNALNINKILIVTR